eukprot:SAG31_NODE_1626_length_7710_cov_28.409933_6_plen_141_part_00
MLSLLLKNKTKQKHHSKKSCCVRIHLGDHRDITAEPMHEQNAPRNPQTTYPPAHICLLACILRTNVDLVRRAVQRPHVALEYVPVSSLRYIFVTSCHYRSQHCKLIISLADRANSTSAAQCHNHTVLEAMTFQVASDLHK